MTIWRLALCGAHEHAPAERTLDALNITTGRCASRFASNPLHHRTAVHFGHVRIKQDEFWPLVSEVLQCFRAARHADDL